MMKNKEIVKNIRKIWREELKDRSKWDLQFFAEVKKLAKLRRSEDAFINGGLRWVAAEDNYLAYLRESKKSKVLVVIAAKPCAVEIDLAKFGYKISKTLSNIGRD